MGLFGLLGKATGDYAGTKMVQKGSDFIINKYTALNVFGLHSGMRKHADELVKQYFLNHNGGGEITEYDAALLKLAVFYASANQASDEHLAGLASEAITTIRQVGEDKICGEVSLLVMSQTGF